MDDLVSRFFDVHLGIGADGIEKSDFPEREKIFSRRFKRPLVVVDEMELAACVLEDVHASDFESRGLSEPLMEVVSSIPELGCPRVAETEVLRPLLMQSPGVPADLVDEAVLMLQSTGVPDVVGQGVHLFDDQVW